MDKGLARRLARLLLLSSALAALGGCSMSQMVVRTSMSLMESSIVAMNRETDLELARQAIPANLKLLDGMLEADPGNARLHLYAAEGYYGYSFGFVERDQPERAARLYHRCYRHGRNALALSGFTTDVETTPRRELARALAAAGPAQVPALFWTASCWAKWVDMNRDDPRSIARLARAAALMERVLALDPGFYHGGPHLFFGVYYGSRPPMLGGDPERAADHFDRARELGGSTFYIIDVLQAEFLDRQLLDRRSFHNRVSSIAQAHIDAGSEIALINAIARDRARWLLAQEAQWF
ncbi:TRAP transporter TatT component family protein [Thiohalobacter sp.]|uniref:TRAP transporter TatT component family protein n=1 Tax=Thiohalobacter sp. TaxID=2025948 RepID=UPI002618B1D8|nr:TRAP transporter TatT component family protein [Thiohalobacter sp.]